ncbi:MAG: hypothetical protein EXR51_04835 [Dehalococcoidia bacterium]|nr:hypothetical protein [Dehalococcoidia bacterium]
MSQQPEIEARIVRERKKVVELRSEIIRREAFIQGLEAALGLLSGNRPVGGYQPQGESLRLGSDVSRAQELLSRARRPLHISAILTGIGKEDTKQTRASLGSSLARYARKGEIFQRGPRPNEFALVVDDNAVGIHDTHRSSPEDSVQLPAIFGS